MPSPFPGMDPFLESQEWEDFHSRLNGAISDQLSESIQPDYFIRLERRVYLERVGSDDGTFRRTDVAILAQDAGPASGQKRPDGTTEALTCTLPVPEERRETYLVIRERTSMEVVTVIELLSPSNKRKGGDGYREYLKKREEIFTSQTHLVEIDLLRSGQRMPIVEATTEYDFVCVVCRAYDRPRAELYGWKLVDRLPSVSIPLKHGDDDAVLHLQDAMDSVYDRARYDLSVDYTAELQPPPTEAEVAWIKQTLDSK